MDMDRNEGLRAAFDNLSPGHRIIYYNHGDVFVNIKPYPNDDGSFGARTWIRTSEQIATSPAYEVVDDAWIARTEQLLRDFGIDPSMYNLIAVPDNRDPWSGLA